MLTLEQKLITEPLIWTEERRLRCADGTVATATENGDWWVTSADGSRSIRQGRAEDLAGAIVEAAKHVTVGGKVWQRALASSWELGHLLIVEERGQGWDCFIGEDDDEPRISVGRAASVKVAKECLGFAVAAFRNCVKTSSRPSTKGRVRRRGATGGPHERWVLGVLAIMETPVFEVDRRKVLKRRPS